MKRPLGDPTRHFFLVRSVARVLGVNLGTEMRAGRISADRCADMVSRCRACPSADHCQNWLAQGQDRPDAPPKGCRNAQTLQKLRRKP